MLRMYQVNFRVRFINRLTTTLVRWGLAPRHAHILTVQGRKMGKVYSIPVSLVEDNGQRWLVAPYGEVSWVRNARAMGTVTLTRGRRSETVSAHEASSAESAAALKKYLTLEPITRPYFEAEASRHPVFRIGGKGEAFASPSQLS